MGIDSKRRVSRRLALCAGVLGLVAASAGLAAPSYAAGGDVCVSIHGTKHVDNGPSTCSSDGSGVAVAVNDSHVGGSNGGVGIGVNDSLATGDGGTAVAVNDSSAQVSGNCHAHAVNGDSVSCP